MEPHEAVAEAARCIYCEDAPCARGCPAGIDVASFIRKIHTGNLRGAARVLLEANVLSASCARVCPTEELCSGRCVLPGMGVRAIDIGQLQRFVMEWAMEQGPPAMPLASDTGKHVAVVGAGPAGIACAVELRRLGHRVSVYDSRQQPGGLVTHAIATHKITPEVAVHEVQWLAHTGFELHLGQQVSPADLGRDHDAVFLGLGLGHARRLEVDGEDLPGVVDAMDIITALRSGRPLPVELQDRDVVVIGGGNTATDAALLCTQQGAQQVTMVYRRSAAEMPAYASELALVRARGSALLLLHAPRCIFGRSQVEGVELQPMRLGDPDGSGRRRPVPREDAPPTTLPCDVVVRALGQTVDLDLPGRIEGLRVKRGRIVVDPRTGRTGNPKYFAGGDCVNGGREVVHAAAEGQRAARGMHATILGQEV